MAVRAASILGVLSLLLTAAPAPGGDVPTWKKDAAARYLNERARWWLSWERAGRGQGTVCVSCHSAVPYALAQPALARLVPAAGTEKRILASVRQRVERWQEILAPRAGDVDPLLPFYGGNRRDSALDTEAVLNALILVHHDQSGATLSATASKALDHMWARQNPSGTWRWLDFGLRPWEKDGEYYGAALAATAAGTAGARYARQHDEGIKQQTAALRKYLQSQVFQQTFHSRALGLWAASSLHEVFSADDRKRLVDDLCALQRPDGGWNLSDLGKEQTGADAPGWKILTAYPDGAASDGYATGLVTLALRRSGISSSDERLKRGRAWLNSQQAADGTWPALYVNRKRDPGDDIGKFMRDAGTALAVLALSELD